MSEQAHEIMTVRSTDGTKYMVAVFPDGRVALMRVHPERPPERAEGQFKGLIGSFSYGQSPMEKLIEDKQS